MFEIWRISSRQYRAAYQLAKKHGFILGNQISKRIGLSLNPILYHLAIDQENPFRAVRVISDTQIYPWLYHEEDVKSFADWYRQLPDDERKVMMVNAQESASGTINKAMQTAPMRDFRTTPPTYLCAQCRISGRACCTEHLINGRHSNG